MFEPGFLAALAMMSVACTSSDFGPPPCPAGDPCGSLIVNGDGGTFDAGATAIVTGVIHEVTDPSFALGAAISSQSVTVAAPTPTGARSTDAPTSAMFSLDGVSVGEEWFLVDLDADDAGPPPISTPTYWRQEVSLMTPAIALPLMSSATLAQIALGVGTKITAGSAHVALLFTRGGKPLEGVTLGALVPATTAFDVSQSSPTTYTTSGTSTGARGILLLLDIAATADVAGFPLSIGVPGTKAPVSLEVPIQSGCMTIGTFEM